MYQKSNNSGLSGKEGGGGGIFLQGFPSLVVFKKRNYATRRKRNNCLFGGGGWGEFFLKQGFPYLTVFRKQNYAIRWKIKEQFLFIWRLERGGGGGGGFFTRISLLGGFQKAKLCHEAEFHPCEAEEQAVKLATRWAAFKKNVCQILIRLPYEQTSHSQLTL